jgi:hypothetical protein
LREYLVELAVLIACAAGTVWLIAKGHADDPQTAAFVVLSITLAVLIWYARATHRMAEVSVAKWERESRPRGRYSMEMSSIQPTPYSGRVMFSLINPSDLILKAKVWCNFQVYGQRVPGDDAFEGKSVWLLFQEQISQSWFEIEPLVQRVGKSIQVMQSEASPTNRDRQLTMDLEIEFRDELGRSYRLPARRHFFEFNTGRWIPLLTSLDTVW